jgi:hypothetical protein
MMAGNMYQTQRQMKGFNPNFNEGNIAINMTPILSMRK